MIEVAVTGWVVYAAVAFGLRTFLHWRATGTSGFLGLRDGAGAIERVAGAAMAMAFVLGLIAPFVGRPLWDAPWIGAAVVGAATLATLGAQLAMGASWRIGVRDDERTALVTRFPFSVVRNPIFSCMIVASVGFALSCPTPLSWLGPLLLLASLEVQVRRVEEPYLRASHGAAYAAYAARVGRFVPGLGRQAR
jgi:protein-S-isoprenylcysteine O-methyltransferase Ste14